MLISKIIFMYSNSFLHQTKKLNLIINYKSDFVPIEKIIVNKRFFAEKCEKGCGVFNQRHSCPPFSPNFENLSKNYKYIFTFILYTNTNQINLKNKFMIIWNCYRTLAPMLYKYGISLEKELNGTFFKCGPCSLCKTCKLKLGKPCAKPEKMRYALESVGISVQALAKQLNHIIFWYRKSLPEYISVVGGVLTNQIIDENDLYKKLLCNL